MLKVRTNKIKALMSLLDLTIPKLAVKANITRETLYHVIDAGIASSKTVGKLTGFAKSEMARRQEQAKKLEKFTSINTFFEDEQID